jgi:hypothetical protein
LKRSNFTQKVLAKYPELRAIDRSRLSVGALIQAIYRTFLKRGSDKEGLRNNINFFEKGTPLEKLIDGFMASEEFASVLAKAAPSESFNRHFVSIETLVPTLYRVFLGREPEENGRRQYIKSFKRGLPLEELILSFIKSEEFVGNYVPGLGARYGKETDEKILGLLHANRRLDAMHALRCELIQKIVPSGETVIDLGGASSCDARGALMFMGYPHRPKKLYIIDLPPEQRVASAIPQKDLVIAKSTSFEGTLINYI